MCTVSAAPESKGARHRSSTKLRATETEATSGKKPRVRRAVQELTNFRQQLKAQQVARAKLRARIEALSSELVGWRARIGRVRGQWEDMQALNAQLRADNAALNAAIHQQKQQLGLSCAPVPPDSFFAGPMAPVTMPYSSAAVAAPAAAPQPGPPAMFPMAGFSAPAPQADGRFPSASLGMVPHLGPPMMDLAPMPPSGSFLTWKQQQQQELSLRRSSSCGNSSGLYSHPSPLAATPPAPGPDGAYMLPRSSSGPYLGMPGLTGPAAATLPGSYSAPAGYGAAPEAVMAPRGSPEPDAAAAGTWVPATAAAGQPSSACAEVGPLAPWEVLPPGGEPPVSAPAHGLVKQLSSNSSSTTVHGSGMAAGGGVSPSDDPLDLLLADDTCWGSESLEEVMGLLGDDKDDAVASATPPVTLPTGGYILPTTALEGPACLLPSCHLEPPCSPLSGSSRSSITGYGLPAPVFNCNMDSWNPHVAPMSTGPVFV